MNKNDIPEIMKISRNIDEFQVDPNFKENWSKEQLSNWIKSKRDIMFVAEEGKEIIGFIMLAHHVPTGKVTWENAWVKPNQRGKNIAGKMYKKAEKQLKKLGATYICAMARPTNKASKRMQEKLGFKEGYGFAWMHKNI